MRQPWQGEEPKIEEMDVKEEPTIEEMIIKLNSAGVSNITIEGFHYGRISADMIRSAYAGIFENRFRSPRVDDTKDEIQTIHGSNFSITKAPKIQIIYGPNFSITKAPKIQHLPSLPEPSLPLVSCHEDEDDEDDDEESSDESADTENESLPNWHLLNNSQLVANVGQQLFNEVLAQQKTTKTEEEKLEEHIATSITKALRESLFVASHHKKVGLPLLISLDSFCGPCLGIHPDPKICYAYANGSSFEGRNYINCTELEASQRLQDFCPFVKYLNAEKGGYYYAGGAVIWAMRRSLDKWHLNFPDDLDIFPVTDNANLKKSGNNMDVVVAAEQIYQGFMREVDQIYNGFFYKTHDIIVTRNSECATIIIYPHNYVNPKQSSKFEDGTVYERVMRQKRVHKLQFCFRAYTHMAQIPGGFDLAASQVISDGKNFWATYPAMIAMQTGILVVDADRASSSWAMRLWKYSRDKDFIIVFMGIDSEIVGKAIDSKTRPGYPFADDAGSYEFPYGFKLMNAPNPFSHNKQSKRAFSFVLAGEDRIGMSNEQRISDYGYGFGHSLITQESLAKVNVRSILTNGPIFVTSPSLGQQMARLVGNETLKHGSIIEKFLEKPAGSIYMDLMKVFYEMADYKKSFTDLEYKTIFGNRAEQAIIYHFRKDWKMYEMMVQSRFSDIYNELQLKFDELEGIKWRVINPGAQNYGSNKRIPMTARNLYGKSYNRFNVSPEWPQKMTILAAMIRRGTEREEIDCLIIKILPKDMIKRIFFWIDEFTVREIMNSKDRDPTITGCDRKLFLPC